MRLGPRPAQVFSRGQGCWRVPISAMLAREAVCCFAPGDKGGTYHTAMR